MRTTKTVPTCAGSVRPLIRWAGSKRRLLPRLAMYWSQKPHRRYLEPFAGSAALFFYINPRYALLNDINPELVNTYAAIKDNVKKVYGLVQSISPDEETYYRMRKLSPASLGKYERAARFVFLNRNCFNGIFRTNKKGVFNVPYGGNKTGALPSIERFVQVSEYLLRATVCSVDFETFVRANVRRHDFVYMDPPYAVGNRRVFRQYDPNTFGIEDINRLGELLDMIDRIGASFLVSYALCSEIGNLATRWHTERVISQRSIAGFTKHRRHAVEVMISNLG